MSQPISQCLQIKAIIDDQTHKQLLEIHKYNHMNGGHYTIFPCTCSPPCWEKYEITNTMLNNYNEKMKIEWNTFILEHNKNTCTSCKHQT